MDLYIGYSSKSDVFLLGYCKSSRAVRSQAVSCSLGNDKLLPSEEPSTKAAPQPNTSPVG